jgi:hypothetical protein
MASSSMEFALQDDDVFLRQQGMDRDAGLDHAVALGVTRIRVNVLWNGVLVPGSTSAHPVYDFSRIDALQQDAADRGIELQLTVAGPAPSWATKNHRAGPDAPDAGKYAAFVRAVVTHFKGRVDRYSIWNEPNWNTWLAPANQAASVYRKLYIAGYAAVKGVDPKAQVLIGELAPSGGGRAIAPLKFLRDVTRKGLKPLKADGMALHPYQLTSAPNLVTGKPDDVTIGSLGRLTSFLDQAKRHHTLTTPKGKALDVYLTEFGYLTAGSRKQPAARAAKWLTQAIGIARKNRRVKEILQYQLIDGNTDRLWHSALINRHGTPWPAYNALVKAFNP